MYTVADVMTRKVVTLKDTDDLAVADTILKLGRIRHLPVVQGGKLVGLITHRDVIRAVAAQRQAANPALARDVMTSELVVVHPETSLRKAIRIMLRNKFGCLPVTEGDRELVGIVTEADLLIFASRIIGDLDRIDDVASELRTPPPARAH